MTQTEMEMKDNRRQKLRKKQAHGQIHRQRDQAALPHKAPESNPNQKTKEDGEK